MIGTSFVTSPTCEPNDVAHAIRLALEKFHQTTHGSMVEQVIFFATPHWQHPLTELLHHISKETGCMQIWGGISHGVYHNGQIAFDQPAVVMALIGTAPLKKQTHTLNMMLGHNDEELVKECQTHHAHAHLGLLSYGPNETRHHGVQTGRIHTGGACHIQMHANKVSIFESSGLEPLGPWGLVTASEGLNLRSVDDQPVLERLKGPTENVHPVGLRLGVQRAGQTQWIPLVAIHGSDSIGLASPVVAGETVCLAARTSQRSDNELNAWSLPSALGKNSDTDNHCLGILMGGLDRSPLCHQDDSSSGTLLSVLANLPTIGAFGQAVWLRSAHIKPDTPALNHRLALALIER